MYALYSLEWHICMIQVESTHPGSVVSATSFIQPFFEVAGGDGPGNVFGVNTNSKLGQIIIIIIKAFI